MRRAAARDASLLEDPLAAPRGDSAPAESLVCTRLAIGLCIFWLLLLFSGEELMFRAQIGWCAWPPAAPSAQRVDRVLLIADPQLIDLYSFEALRIIPPLRGLVERMTDGYMRKCFDLLADRLRPDLVVLLGDLMDSGRLLDDLQFARQLQRFWHVFRWPRERLALLPGNHDLGSGRRKAALAERFERTLGPLSWERPLGPLVWTAVATTEIAPPLHRGPLANATWTFVGGLLPRPRVLLSHVPLHRPYDRPCGPLRWSGRPLPDTDGPGYVTQLRRDVSARLLVATRPLAVFSGDDHEPCQVLHEIPNSTLTAPELTVGTFNYMQGVLWPSLALVTQSSWCSPDAPSRDCIKLTARVCWLPSQPLLLVSYGLASLVSLAVLIGDARRQLHKVRARAAVRARDGQGRVWSPGRKQLVVRVALQALLVGLVLAGAWTGLWGWRALPVHRG